AAKTGALPRSLPAWHSGRQAFHTEAWQGRNKPWSVNHLRHWVRCPVRDSLAQLLPRFRQAALGRPGGSLRMRFDKLTIKAQEAVVRAQELAQQRDHTEVLPLHLLSALLDEEGGVVQPILQKLGANVGRIQQVVSSELERLPKATGTQLGMSR